MITLLRASAALLFGALLLAGCADSNMFGNSELSTSSIGSQPKVDPACTSLAAQIDTLRREGVADKIEKAAVKKYKMTTADLAKADQLTKANSEFQVKCSTLPPRSATQTSPAHATGASPKAAPARAALAQPAGSGAQPAPQAQ